MLSGGPWEDADAEAADNVEAARCDESLALRNARRGNAWEAYSHAAKAEAWMRIAAMHALFWLLEDER